MDLGILITLRKGPLAWVAITIQKQLAKDRGNNEVRCAAVCLVTGACFIGNDNDEATAEVLVLLEQPSLINATP